MDPVALAPLMSSESSLEIGGVSCCLSRDSGLSLLSANHGNVKIFKGKKPKHTFILPDTTHLLRYQVVTHVVTFYFVKAN